MRNTKARFFKNFTQLILAKTIYSAGKITLVISRKESLGSSPSAFQFSGIGYLPIMISDRKNKLVETGEIRNLGSFNSTNDCLKFFKHNFNWNITCDFKSIDKFVFNNIFPQKQLLICNIDLLCKSIDCSLHENNLPHERVNWKSDNISRWSYKTQPFFLIAKLE